jgi:hypothetical protein
MFCAYEVGSTAGVRLWTAGKRNSTAGRRYFGVGGAAEVAASASMVGAQGKETRLSSIERAHDAPSPSDWARPYFPLLLPLITNFILSFFRYLYIKLV